MVEGITSSLSGKWGQVPHVFVGPYPTRTSPMLVESTPSGFLWFILQTVVSKDNVCQQPK